MNVAIGGFVAYTGLIVFLGALGMLIAFALQQLNLNPFLSAFIGLGAIGFIVIAVGAIMLLGGLKALRRVQSLPETGGNRDAAARKGNEKSHQEPTAPKPKKDERSSEQIEAAVVQTEARRSRHSKNWVIVSIDTFAVTGKMENPENICYRLKPSRIGAGRSVELHDEGQVVR